MGEEPGDDHSTNCTSWTCRPVASPTRCRACLATMSPRRGHSVCRPRRNIAGGDLQSRQARRARPPVPLFGNLAVRGNDADLAVAGGTLAYALPGTNTNETLMWVDRAGAMTPVDTAWHDPELEAYALSPDGGRLAIGIAYVRRGDRPHRHLGQADGYGPPLPAHLRRRRQSGTCLERGWRVHQLQLAP